MSILGGEPTVYRQLGDLVTRARDLGYSFVRVTTNGMFASSLLADPRMRGVDVICFSIDGATAAVNDAIRKGSRLERVLQNMRDARGAGFEVRVNATITSRNIDHTIELIELAQASGASEVNLNVMFLMGDALTHQDLAVSPAAWRSTYETILRRHREFSIRIKVPAAFATASELPAHRANGHRCHAMDGSRWYVASNGQVFPCLLFMDHANAGIARDAGDDVHDYCHFVNMPSAGLHPLCIFYKDRLNATTASQPDGAQSIVCPPQML